MSEAIGTDINEQVKNRLDKLEALKNEGRDPFEITEYDVSHHTSQIHNDFDALSGSHVSIAGRLMQKRVMGKASFANVADRDGNIQIYLSKDSLGEEAYKEFKKYDIGDLVGVSGEVFKTQKGEISIHADKIVLLAKSIQVLPEKYHGLKDVDQRYRQRYVDLIVNPDVRDTFKKRSQILSEIRDFLNGRDFIEVETPILVDNAGGAAARPFLSHYNALGKDVKLRISLELYLKRLIVGGFERVYEIGRVFRNEGVDGRHNPEFTLLELYQAFTDYNGMMELTENLLRDVALKVTGSAKVKYGDDVLDFEAPFEKITMVDAVKKYSGVDFDKVTSTEEAKSLAKEHGVDFEDRHKKGDILSLFFEKYVEDKLIQPTFVIDHPIEISPLTKKIPGNPDYTERFELFVAGRELANAYSELNDPIDQRERFEEQEKLLLAGDDEAQTIDEDFMNALSYGMPPTGGVGIGIDRLVMLLTNEHSIRDVLLFPTMRSVAGTASEEGRKQDVVKTEEGDDTVGFFMPNEKIDFSGIKVEDFLEDDVDFETFCKSDFRTVKVKACEAVPKSDKLLKFTLDDGSGTDRTILSGIHKYYEPEDLIGKTLIAIVNLPVRKMMGIDSCGMIISAVYDRDGEEKLHVLMVDNHIPAGAKLC